MPVARDSIKSNGARQAIDAARKNIAEGEAALALAWSGLKPRSTPPASNIWPAAQAPVVMAAETLCHLILTAERQNRAHTAALYLVNLRKWFDDYPVELPPDEDTWEKFAGKRLAPMPLDRIRELIGSMVYRNAIVACSRCGAETVCPCGCGEPYLPDHPWARGVTENVTINPSKSVELPANDEMASKAKSLRGRPPTGKATTSAERMRRLRARHTSDDPAATTLDGRVIPGAVGALLLRSSTVADMAHYDDGDPVTDDAIAAAKHAADKWRELYHQLKERRKA